MRHHRALERPTPRHHLQAITHPDDLGAGLAYLDEALHGERRSFQTEKRYVHADGHVVWVALSTWAVPDSTGLPLCFLTQVHDITAAKLAEDALRDRERQLSEAQQLARLGSWQWDIASNRVQWSDQLYLMFGLDPAHFEATYQAYLAQVHVEDRQVVHETITRALKTHELFSLEHRSVEFADGAKWIRSRGLVEVDEKGTPVAMHGTAQDFTEAKRAEEENQKRQQLLNAVLEHLEEVIVACDAEGILTLFNRAARDFHGLPPRLPPGRWAEHYDLYGADGRRPWNPRRFPSSGLSWDIACAMRKW